MCDPLLAPGQWTRRLGWVEERGEVANRVCKSVVIAHDVVFKLANLCINLN